MADVRVEGISSDVVVVWSDDGGEINEGSFGKLYREQNIKQEFAIADRPEYNSVAEQGLVMVGFTALAANMQASECSQGLTFPKDARREQRQLLGL